jgi:hypothetical protein
MKNRVFGKVDLILIAAVTVCALLFIFMRGSASDGGTAVITVNSSVIEELNLKEIKERTVITPDTDPKVTIVAENGEIYFESSECRDKICVRTGRLSKPGDTAVCLPAKTVVSITGSGPDAITY